MRKQLLSMTVAAAMFFVTARPSPAHHAFGGEFDPDHPILLKGKIVKVEWVNPHTWIHVEIAKPDGATEVWMIEGGSPNTLLRHGVTRASLPIGTEIVVDGYQSRDHSLRANGRNITYPDGRKLLLGSSAPEAQNDKDSPETKK